jgi:hypothetical protein
LAVRLSKKNVKIKIYQIIVFPVALYECETWSPTSRQERRLRVFKNRVLRRIFGPRSFVFFLLIKYYAVDEIKKTELGRACSTYGGEEQYIHESGGENRGKETT